MCEWISVKDRLPDRDGEYLIFDNSRGYEERVVIDYRVAVPNYWEDSKEWEYHPSFWMEIPEVPK